MFLMSIHYYTTNVHIANFIEKKNKLSIGCQGRLIILYFLLDFRHLLSPLYYIHDLSPLVWLGYRI